MPEDSPTNQRSSFKERVKQEREQEILDAARDVFAECGFERASLDHIAERVGIGKGTIYLHFASKEDLLTALMQRGSESLLEKFKAGVAANASAVEKLDAVLRCLLEHRAANERWMRVVVNEMPYFVGRYHRKGASTCVRDMVAGVIAEGQASGELHPGIPPKIAAITLFLLVFLAPEVDGDTSLTSRQLYDSASRMFFHGIS